MLHVQNFLSNKSLADLNAMYGVSYNRSAKYPNIVTLKYSMIDSPMSEPIVRECRGIILDESNNWNVISRGFDKFFNYGEGHADCIDWSTARVQEKVDGSLIMVYWYNGEYHVATTGTPDASGTVHGSAMSFADYFWKAYGGKDTFPTGEAQGYVHFFELTGPLNRVVIPHQEISLTILGGRRTDTWEEVKPSDMHRFHGSHKVVKEFPLQSFDDIMVTFNSMSPLSQEGYVVVDAAFHRVKVKHPGYVAIHHAKDGLSSIKSFVQIARSGEIPEFLTVFPEYKPMLEEAQTKLAELIAELQAVYDAAKDIPVQKDFALKVKGCRCPGAMFALRAGQSDSLRHYFAEARIDSLMVLLGYKEDKRIKSEE